MRRPARYLHLAVVTLLAACRDDALSIVSPTALSDANFWNQEQAAVLSLSGAYAKLPTDVWVVGLDGVTDNATINRQFDWRYVYADGTNNATGAFSADTWSQFYAGIARANVLLANIDRIPATAIAADRRARYKAEARFLRAVWYSYLVNLFGDVPLVTTPLSVDEARSVSRTPAAVVVNQVLADLDSAAAVLPVTYAGADYGRATKGAALAFKARAALFAGRYQVAADAALAVMTLGQYALHESYGGLFGYAGERSAEIIFTRQYAKDEQATDQESMMFDEFGPPTSGGLGRVVPTRDLVDAYVMANGRSTGDAGSGFVPGPASMYDGRDPRLAATILYPGAEWDGVIYDSRPRPLSTTPEAINPQDETTPVTGYNIRKYIDLADRDETDNGGIDVILMRYADVLLMYAEAMVELGKVDGTVYAAVNAVRARAGVAPVAAQPTSSLREVIRTERRVELAFEGLRMFDIRRWRIADRVMPTSAVRGIDYLDAGQLRTILVPASARSFAARNYLWPIPQSEIDINPRLTQNPGY